MQTGLITQFKKIIQDAVQDLGFDIRTKDISIEHPQDKKYGDYSTNIALVLAKKEGQNPMDLAQNLKEKLEKRQSLSVFVSKIETAPPGFLNFHLSSAYLKDKSQDLFNTDGF
nr:hypothetical protein [Bacteroidota bacterium]